MRNFGVQLSAVLMFVAAAALAQDRSGKQLMEQCRAQGAERTSCNGFIKQAVEAWGEGEGFCLPAEFDPEQVRQAYVSWAGDYPDELGKTALAALKLALVEQFPCEE